MDLELEIERTKNPSTSSAATPNKVPANNKLKPSGLVEFYGKRECGTCRKAKAYLDKRKVKYNVIDIIENPPPRSFLEKWVSAKEIKKYLNSRADIYKEKGLGTRVPTKTEAIRLMVKDPNLIKRPLIKFKDRVAFGFDEDKMGDILK